MPFTNRVVEQALKKKGFREQSGDHKYYCYWTIDGNKTLILTKTSHGGKQDIGDQLLHEMAKQCKINNLQFQDLVRCPLSREKYEEILRIKNVIE